MWYQNIGSMFFRFATKRCPLPPEISVSQKVAQLASLTFFVNKIQVQSNKVCYKVSLRENLQQQCCSSIIHLSNGV